MNLKRKICGLMMAAIMMASNCGAGVYASGQEADGAAGKEKVLSIDVEQAIELAMQNNMDLKSLDVDVRSAALSREMAERAEKKLSDGKNRLSDASESIGALEQLAGKLPEGVKLGDIAGSNAAVAGLLEEHPEFSGLDKAGLEKNVINPARDAIESGDVKLELGIADVNESIKDKLDITASRYLSMSSSTKLLTTMAQLQESVTGSGYKIAGKSVALLTRKRYYDVLKASRIEEIKRLALERAKRQYEMARASYEEGMKAKDDMLLSRVQLNLLSAAYTKSQMDRKNAEIELKRVMNIDMATSLRLIEDFSTDPLQADLNAGLAQGLEKRIEMQKLMAQYVVDKLNFELTRGPYPENTYQYKEAKVKLEKAQAELEKGQVDTSAQIRQSYESLVCAAQMLEYTGGIVEDARESLAIAQLRYEEGYSFETSGIKSSGLSDFAGTIVEVIAAQERLADVEEKTVDIIYSYNLAKDKYLNDIGTY
ncbi:outer membrane protein-like protein [Peptoclostridium acidaminophilum DSM 3953]|uniref:Outer membrane protein-like protein n=1 Tax=Peptoclostridium acidaminophilum DSM 3953 TaxID=1286171 RepID=W8T4E1_PEPAC|nr:TolC family protein [Peptoclostridium acidaminophilum]AHM55670.1 outer membrane protein-like protein [Peptoclostridium acidaminophilum DSM 3953]